MNKPLTIPLRTSRGQNAREHHHARAKRVKAERSAVAWSLLGKPKPALPCVVHMTRIAPSNGLDDDNLTGALKAVRDQIAEWLGVDDKDTARVKYVCHQERGPWGVRIAFASEDEFLRSVKGLRPLGPNDPLPELRMLTARCSDGSRVRIVCSGCGTDGFEKQGDLYHCWNCDGKGDTLKANGDGWLLVKRAGVPA